LALLNGGEGIVAQSIPHAAARVCPKTKPPASGADAVAADADTEFVPELDVLRPALQEPARLLGVPPQLSIPLPRYAPGPGQGPRPVTDAAVAQPKKRAGWIGGSL